jgi:hypothetical protein
MDHCPQVALVHSRAARINVHGDIVGYLDFPRENQAGRIAVKLYDRRASICCPTVLLRKKCLDVTGLFDETMRATEDRDLWFRIAEHYEIAYIDETLAHLRLTPGSMSSDPGRMLKWQLFFVRKHYARRACGRTALLRALGQIYREQGDFFFSRGELSRSIGYYSLSVLCNPLRIKNVYMLFRAGAEPLLSGIRTMRMPRSIKGKLG